MRIFKKFIKTDTVNVKLAYRVPKHQLYITVYGISVYHCITRFDKGLDAIFEPTAHLRKLQRGPVPPPSLTVKLEVIF
jgi:hypothetical protein